MADFSLPAPYEPQKSSYIHDRATRPKRPPIDWRELTGRFWGLGMGVAFSVIFTVALFELRDSWDNHRDWLVMLIPFFAIAGLAFGHLMYRGKWEALAVPGGFLLLTGIFTVSVFLGDIDGMSRDTRRIVAALGGISMALTIVSAIVALLWVELREPAKAPPPQL